MTALLLLWRVKAWIGAGLCRSAARKGKAEGGWPDKSAAVGVGCEARNCAALTAVARNTQLALSPISAMFSEQIAPSAADGLKSATLSR